MISRNAILHLMKAGLIKVTPEPQHIGPNSIDLHLGDSLKMYDPRKGRVAIRDPVSHRVCAAIDPKNPPVLLDVPKVGPAWASQPGFENHWLLVPGQFYLGVTQEETYCRGLVPHLDGRSTCGRLSIEAHKTAGVGDNGFQGRWTLEIEVTEPVLVAPGDRLFQLYFTPCWGEGLAYFIQSIADGTPATFHGPRDVALGPLLPDGCPRDSGPLLELQDLYGEADGHHYQGSAEVRGPSPLD